MVQHYIEEHGTYVQYIQNDSEDQICQATSSIKVKNMLLCGDVGDVVEPPRRGGSAEPRLVKTVIGVPMPIHDITKFNGDIYDEITNKNQSYNIKHEINPG